MNKKTLIKTVVDFAMTALLLLLMTYELIGTVAHEWMGIAMFALVIARHVLAFLPIPGAGWARTVHLLCGHWGFVLMSLHLGLHWGAMFRQKNLVWRIVGLGIAIYGVFAFIKRGLPGYMLLQNQFVFFDFSEPLAFFLLDCLYHGFQQVKHKPLLLWRQRCNLALKHTGLLGDGGVQVIHWKSPFISRPTTKEQALKTLLEHGGLSPEEAVAFGDDVTDLGSVMLAGTGIAVQNACEEMKQRADMVCRSNDEDGPALWLNERVLKPLGAEVL